MKRIIALILVVVMAAATLVGCAYSYANDDLSNYATFDKESFAAAIRDIEVLDGEFTTDETKRAEKVIDAIYQSLAADLDDGDHLKTGTPKKYDMLYYSFYCTFEKDGATITILADNMKEASAVKLQLGMVDLEGYEKAISDAILNNYDLTDKVYVTHTTGPIVAGDIAYISYTCEYSTVVDGATTPVKETVTNKRVTLTAGDAFADKLIGKTVGVKETFTIGEGNDAKSYTDVIVNWVVDSETKLGEFEDVTYTEKKSVKDVEGKEHDLKDVNLKYHVYPVYYLAVDEFDADSVLNVLLGADITTTILDVFEDENYKYTDADGKTTSLADLVTKLAELQKALDTAEKDYDTKSEDYTKKQATADAEGATAADKEAANRAKTDLETAETALKSAKEAVDAQIEKIYGTGEDIKVKIVEDYKKQAYAALESSYNTEIKTNLAKILYQYINKYVTVSSHPEKAVKETYERLLENYEYSFHTGKYDSDEGISNYAYYNGSFDSFLMAKTSTETKAAALEKVMAEAKTYVEPILKIYVVAKAFDVLVTDEAFAQYKKDFASYEYYETNYGESSVRTAYQFDKILNHFLEVAEDKVDDEGKITYVDGKIPFVNIGYTPVEELSSDSE